jgi:hypothetical protein
MKYPTTLRPWLIGVPAAFLALGATAAAAETCNLYQYLKREQNPGTLCSAYTAPWAVAPVPVGDSGANPTFYARAAPKCVSGKDLEVGGAPCLAATSEVHSLDGTRAFYHIDAVAGSNKWVIFLQGGGSCGQLPGWANPAAACYSASNADDGFDGYASGLADALEMTSFHPNQATSNIKNRITGTGAMRPDVGAGFADWNRIIIDKTTFDRFYGNQTNAVAWGTTTVNLHFHGAKIIQAMLNDLNRARGIITLDGVAISKLSAATDVVLMGNSGGSGGVIMLAQRCKSLVAAIAPTKVAFVIDARMLPDLNSEAVFANAANSLWTNVASGVTQIRNSVNASSPTHDAVVAWSNNTYQNGGDVKNLVKSWGNSASVTEPFLDASCLASHPGTPWPCYSEQHVLAHHTDEDFFIHQTLGDSNHGNAALTYYDTVDTNSADGYNPIEAIPGFRFNGAPSGYTYMNEKANRVIYTVNELLQNRKANKRDDTALANPSNRLGVYVAYGNCHTSIQTVNWQNHTMTKGASTVSAEQALTTWLAGATDQAWIQDSGPDAYNPGTWTATFPVSNLAYGGWTTTWTTCP